MTDKDLVGNSKHAYLIGIGGVGMSALASRVNWGAVFWDEPRMRISLNMLAVALLALSANLVLPWPRLRGLVNLLLPVVIVWANRTAPLVLHPANAVGDTTSMLIRLTFAATLALAVFALGVVVWLVGRK